MCSTISLGENRLGTETHTQCVTCSNERIANHGISHLTCPPVAPRSEPEFFGLIGFGFRSGKRTGRGAIR